MKRSMLTTIICLIALAVAIGFATATRAVATSGAASSKAVSSAKEPYGWLLQLRGAARSQDLTGKQFQKFTHQIKSTVLVDPSDSLSYEGTPLYRLIGLIDDKNPKKFNVTLAEKGYWIEAKGLDGFTAYFNSKDIAGNADIIVANRVGGRVLPLGSVKVSNGAGSFKPTWPCKIESTTLTGKSKVGGLARIIVYKVGVTPPGMVVATKAGSSVPLALAK